MQTGVPSSPAARPTDGSAPVTVVGSINQDVVIETPRRPRPGETVGGARVSLAGGGKGANQAVAAALLGAGVHLVGRVGDDPPAAVLRSGLVAAGVDVTHVLATPACPSGTAFVTVTPDGENAIVVAPGANERLGRPDVRRAAALLGRSALLVAQLEVPVEAVAAAVELAGPHTLVLLNAAPVRPLARGLLDRVDVLVVNEVEAAGLLGASTLPPEPHAYRGLGPAAVVVTAGAAGSHAYVDGRRIDCPAVAGAVVDTTGAGDAFVGALAAWFAREGTRRGDDLDGPLGRGLEAASLVAAHAVGRLGAQRSYARAEELGPPWGHR